jgi:hypothetical protein
MVTMTTTMLTTMTREGSHDHGGVCVQTAASVREGNATFYRGKGLRRC